ncbi:hypothetical protein CC1G_13834 [Coprinopsis cinerea okayama7|uniref:Uncharacterized protein n=1 Tax=Coprinopsis cinerea (strain Okayama-7 / 130 / ATCC MYA-4618 / FGSC 9003) TaxID=240176 RepID=D6RKJ6_COPC7|nr:hypothetical protein CC1G_13834 [Coprinopsis cinerea okayama7\|eukprot:XP_002911799.1 hypothetical protein CC1G_13834 [Coprinopsis cinerea okayama7\
MQLCHLTSSTGTLPASESFQAEDSCSTACHRIGHLGAFKFRRRARKNSTARSSSRSPVGEKVRLEATAPHRFQLDEVLTKITRIPYQRKSRYAGFMELPQQGVVSSLCTMTIPSSAWIIVTIIIKRPR